jgi:hypothetical protein
MSLREMHTNSRRTRQSNARRSYPSADVAWLGRLGLELLPMALSQFVHETMTFRYVPGMLEPRASHGCVRRFQNSDHHGME